MSESDEEQWEKVREMVRNSPPGTAQSKWDPKDVPNEPVRRNFPTKTVITVLILGLIAAGAYFALEHGGELPAIVKPIDTTPTADRPMSATTPQNSPSARAPAEEAAGKGGKTASVKAGAKSINVRASAATNSAAVAKLSGGQQVEKIAEAGDWIRIRFQSQGTTKEGWVRRDLIDD